MTENMNAAPAPAPAELHAESEFRRFVDEMELDVDPAMMDEDERKAFDLLRRRLLDALRRGQLVIDKEGRPVFTPTGATESITFNRPRGKDLLAMDRHKAYAERAKTFTVMAEITKAPRELFENMAGRDLRICLSITSLFFS